MASQMSQPPAANSPGNRFQTLGFSTSQALANSTTQISQRAQTMANTSAVRNTRSMRVGDHTSLSQAANPPSTQQRLQSGIMTNQNYERSQPRTALQPRGTSPVCPPPTRGRARINPWARDLCL